MTTSSSERNRCTRISPSAVLDDRLQGKELEWARDHLLRCDACRQRVEDFREMLLRVGRLPSTPIAGPAIDQAYAIAVPQAIREIPLLRPYEFRPPPVETEVAGTTMMEVPAQPPAYEGAEVAEVPDPLSDLEREIFRDSPWEDRPEALPPVHAVGGFRDEPAASLFAEESALEPGVIEPEPVPPPSPPPLPEVLAGPVKEVPVDSHQPVQSPPAEPVFEWSPAVLAEPSLLAEPAVSEPSVLPEERGPETLDEVAERPEAADIAPSARSDNVMRIAVGLGAAACVLLAAVLYESGGLLKTSSVKTAATGTARASASATPRPTPKPSPSVLPSTSVAPVIARVGDGATGGSVIRIRPGNALPTFTRLVFDLAGSGLPAMVVTRPDELHVVVTFRNTTGANVPVNGIHSIQVAGVERAVQDGPDLVITIDLNRPVRPVIFTMAPSGGHPFRLVLDLYNT